jgi:sortase A
MIAESGVESGARFLVCRDMTERISNLSARAFEWLRGPDDLHEVIRGIWLRSSRKRLRSTVKIAELALWAIAICSLGYCGFRYGSAAGHQFRQRARLNAAQRERRVADGAGGTHASPASLTADKDSFARNGLLGAIEIPRLNISSVVEEGVSDSTLWEAVGHIPGTAMPGQNGNSALAAHRDTYFRGLGEVQVGDEIVFHSPDSNFRYRVSSTHIVEGGATDALPDSDTPTLSLITCYPFHYIGAAPQRFIVTAREETSSQ